jgi:hypothetical protein
MNKTVPAGTKFYTVLKCVRMRKKGYTAFIKQMRNIHDILV